MKTRKHIALMVLTAFVLSVFANFTPAFAADSNSSSITNINKSITSGSTISENKQGGNASGAVSAAGAAKGQKQEQKLVDPKNTKPAVNVGASECFARRNRLSIAAYNYARIAKANKSLYPRSAGDLVKANYISKDEIYCPNVEKGLFGPKKTEYSFKLQEKYEKYIFIECPNHPGRITTYMPTDMSKEDQAKDKECKKECTIKMISAAGAVSRAVRVAVHDKKMYPREIGDLVRSNHLTKNDIQCPQEIKKLFGTKHEEFMLRLQGNEKSYTLDCPYHGSLINIKVPKYEDTLNVNEKEELAKDKAREEKLKEAVKDGLILAAAAPLIPIALTVAGGVWAANAAYDAGKKAGAFVAEKGKEAGEAAAKTAKAAGEAISDAGEAIYDTGVKAGEAAAKTARDAAEAAKAAGEAAVDTGKRAAEAVAETGRKAGEAVVNAGKAAGEAVVNAGEAVVETGRKAVDEAGKALANAGVAAAETGIGFLDGAQSFINGGLNKLKSGLSSWKSGLKK